MSAVVCSLGLEKEDGAVPEVEVDEVFRLWLYLSVEKDCEWDLERAVTWSSPWVTKLPKLRPTMQCHVAPLRESNYRMNQVSTDQVGAL